jgi:tRNA(fMet)-specific endonuclease VapC
MVTHLLDTSVYSQPLKPRPLSMVMSRWNALGNESLSVSAICEAEVLFGLEWKKSDELDSAYKNLLQGKLAILPVELEVVRVFAKLKAVAKRQGRLIPDFDLLIAATAKSHRLILATLNYRHFEGIEGLAVEDWSK